MHHFTHDYDVNLIQKKMKLIGTCNLFSNDTTYNFDIYLLIEDAFSKDIC